MTYIHRKHNIYAFGLALASGNSCKVHKEQIEVPGDSQPFSENPGATRDVADTSLLDTTHDDFKRYTSTITSIKNQNQPF